MPKKTLYTDLPLERLAQLGVQGDLKARADIVFCFFEPITIVCKINRYLLEPIKRELKKEDGDVIHEFCIYLIEKRFSIFTDLILNRGKLDVKEITWILIGGIALRRAFSDFRDRLRTIHNGTIDTVPIDIVDNGKIKKDNDTEIEEELSSENDSIFVENESVADSIKIGDESSEDFYQGLLRENNFSDTDKQFLFMALSLNHYRFEARHFQNVDGPDGIISLPDNFEIRLKSLKNKLIERSIDEDVYTVREGDIADLFDLPMNTKDEVQLVRNLIKKAKYNACKLLGRKYG